MIINNKEFYSSPYYFFLKETKDKYSLYFSVEETLTEARKKDSLVQFHKDKEKEVKTYLKNILKKSEKKSTQDIKGELEELVNADGGLSSSRIPILDPKMHPKKTMDQTIAAARITNDPITRGYRTYFGESELSEEDMSDAFGFKETKDLDGKETFKYFLKKLEMEPEDAKKRTEQQGKKISFDKNGKVFDKMSDKSEYKDDPDFIARQILPEIQKQKAIKVLEDILVNKKNKDTDIGDKEPKKISNIVKKNLNTLKKQAEKEGLSISELIKMLKGE
jgi:ribosomal protein L22